uniref:acetoin dehydrogenase dihydrolipoyllysine-residue acetyltransferase subunit n=1 Tax=Pararhizobium sp. IMCC3301 TaxID=3067904 RepID=UPI002741600B|nr:acetoin dehydrogenase dihydrolipoyllysine-residue acetyltransferase subunit [Pararhizobium sp. IMCC3301]
MTMITLAMPRLGETMEQGTITSWLVEPGQSFKRGDPLLELETDKTLVEYPALGAGTLVKILAAPGDVVDVGEPIAQIESDDPAMSTEAEAPVPEQKPESAGKVPTASSGPKIQTVSNGGSIRATPLARRKARQAGLALADISGTGRRGRIEAGDVEAARGGDSVAASVRPGPDASADATGGFVLVHGFAGDQTGWAALAGALRRAGHKVDAVDLPGHGGNEGVANHPEDLVAWLSAYLNRAAKPVHLVGHSLGAFVAARAAAEMPQAVARLTLIAPAGCGLEINGAFVSGMADAQSVGEVSHLLRLLGPKAATLSAEGVSAMAAQLAKGRLTALAAAMARGNTQCIDTISAIAALPESLPVSALFGVADAIIPRDQIFNMPPRVALHVLRAGHMPQWDAPSQVERLLTQGMDAAV